MMRDQVDILAFGAHPDDVDFGCGGILAHARHQGLSLAIADLTLGERGSGGSPEVRKAEGLRAAELLGARRTLLNFADCEIADTPEGRLELVRAIRQYRPRLVLAPYWQGAGNHPDHRACGLLARHACRLARLAKILPETPPHSVGHVLHYLFPWEDGATFLVDISPYVSLWRQVIEAHASQCSVRPYLDWCLRTAQRLGLFLGTEYAQGLVQSHPLSVSDLRLLFQGSLEL